MSKIIKPASVAENWLTTHDAIRQLGRTKATLYRLVAAGEVRSKAEKREGRKPERLFHENDIRQAVTDKVRVRPLAQLPAAAAPPPPPVPARPVLGIQEAATVSGLPEGYIRRLCRERKIAAIQYRQTWYLARKSLEHFIETGFGRIGAL